MLEKIATDTLTIGAAGGPHVLVDPHEQRITGLADSATRPIACEASITLATEGTEVPGTMGGLEYRDTVVLEARPRDGLPAERHTAGPEASFALESEVGDWAVRLGVALRPEHPRIALTVAVSRIQGEGRLRDVRVTLRLPGLDLDEWRVEAPGNRQRVGVRADEIPGVLDIQTAGHELGAPGMVALHRPGGPVSLVVWPLARSEQTAMHVHVEEDSVAVAVDTQLGGLVGPGEWLDHGPIYLDVVASPWDDVLAGWAAWYDGVGIHTPEDRPDWASSVSIFEVMLGSTPFRGGLEYAPYPEIDDLIADLDRIAGLGFQCLQLMPRHPYPSYNIHEPGDIATTYGDPDDMRRLVDACHARGLRIILDILLHGVLDQEVMRRAVDLVRSGPHAGRLDEPCFDPFDSDSVEVSWARHILEFAPHWIGGAPEHHRLLDEHPEWFMRDSAGEVVGVYTHALDIANDAWQDHFIAGCEAMVTELGIDGYRLDAPLYNRFANWSTPTRRHASYSSTGALRLIARMRRRLHAISPDLMLHTEVSGPRARVSLDLNYGYEELWLIGSLFDDRLAEPYRWRRVRTGRDLARWCHDFDAALPPGSAIAHFVDCHDTIWWRLPGDMWRREQFGEATTRALVALYALRGGGYMTFVGGERGVEDELRRVHALRRWLPEIRAGAVDYGAVTVDDERVYAVLRHEPEGRATLIAINLSDEASVTSCSVTLPSHVTVAAGGPFSDLWSQETLAPARVSDGRLTLALDLGAMQVRVIALSGAPVAIAPSRGGTGGGGLVDR